MSNNQQHDRLNDLIGKVIVYNNKQYKVLDVKIQHERVNIRTDKNILDFDEYGIGSVLAKMNVVGDFDVEVVSRELEKPVVTNLVKRIDFGPIVLGDTAFDVIDIIKDNIRNVSADANFIPQARAIKEQVDTLIDFAKLQISLNKQG